MIKKNCEKENRTKYLLKCFPKICGFCFSTLQLNSFLQINLSLFLSIQQLTVMITSSRSDNTLSKILVVFINLCLIIAKPTIWWLFAAFLNVSMELYKLIISMFLWFVVISLFFFLPYCFCFCHYCFLSIIGNKY